MSGITKASTDSAEDIRRWAALEKQNERLVDAAHPLLAELTQLGQRQDDALQAAS